MKAYAFGAAICVLAWGCGGSGDLFLAAPDDGGDGSASSDAGSDGASFNDGAAARDGLSDAPAAPDAPSGTVLADGGVGAEGGPGGSTSALPCGAATCGLPGETCCVAGGGGGSTTFACVAGTSCANVGGGGGGGGGAVALECSSAANCPIGAVCCLGNANGLVATCQATCGQNQVQLCDPSATLTGCLPGVACSSSNIGDWNLPPSYATCGGRGN